MNTIVIRILIGNCFFMLGPTQTIYPQGTGGQPQGIGQGNVLSLR